MKSITAINEVRCPKCQGWMYLEESEYGVDWACLNCGKRISQQDMEVIMNGQKDWQNLSADEKRQIAQEAKQKGTKQIAREKNLPMGTVRAWVGVYCRKPKQPTLKSSLGAKYGLPLLPPFDNTWTDQVKVKWFEVYLELAKLLKGEADGLGRAEPQDNGRLSG